MKKVLFYLFIGCLFTNNSFACISVPKKIKLSGSSFEKDYVSFPETEYGVGIQQGDDIVFYHQELHQWCVIQKSQLSMKPQCLKEGTEFFITQEAEGENKGKVSGMFKIHNGELMLFSATGDKKQDRSKPYLKFSSQPKYSDSSSTPSVGQKIKTGFHVEALSFKEGTLGEYDILSMLGELLSDGKVKTPKFRGLGAPEEDVVDILSSSVSAEANCGGKLVKKPFEKQKAGSHSTTNQSK